MSSYKEDAEKFRNETFNNKVRLSLTSKIANSEHVNEIYRKLMKIEDDENVDISVYIINKNTEPTIVYKFINNFKVNKNVVKYKYKRKVNDEIVYNEVVIEFFVRIAYMRGRKYIIHTEEQIKDKTLRVNRIIVRLIRSSDFKLFIRYIQDKSKYLI